MKIDIKRNTRNFDIDYTMIEENIDMSQIVDIRESVRGIYLQGSKILVVYSDERLYGTPGGGIEESENREEALLRELREETGAMNSRIIKYLGKINEFRTSGLYKTVLFNPIQHYYLVNIESFGEQNLVGYETDMNLQYGFVDINEAIASNTKKLSEIDKNYRVFYYFQTELFKLIKELYHL